MKNSKEIYMYVLGALIVAGVFLLTYFFLFRVMPKENTDIMLLLVGAMLAKFSDVIGYFFGSSKSSADKNEMLFKSTPAPGNPTPGATPENGEIQKPQ